MKNLKVVIGVEDGDQWEEVWADKAVPAGQTPFEFAKQVVDEFNLIGGPKRTLISVEAEESNVVAKYLHWQLRRDPQGLYVYETGGIIPVAEYIPSSDDIRFIEQSENTVSFDLIVALVELIDPLKEELL